MHFTREPIIETVVTPKDGCKLVVRSSKGSEQDEYLVDAVEVVSFGQSQFFRSMEKPKSFLVPVSDYEVFEVKETRMMLKNIGTEKSIKIGGGNKTKEADTTEEKAPETKKKDRKRYRKKRSEKGSSEKKKSEKKPESKSDNKSQETEASKEQSTNEEVSQSFISKLFPPPPNLIKEKYQAEEKLKEVISEESIATEIPEVEISTKEESTEEKKPKEEA